MNNKPIVESSLSNGLTLFCIDQSKKIAADRWYVKVSIQIPIPMDRKWFDHLAVDEDRYCQIKEKLGDQVVFEQQEERNFVSKDAKDEIISGICDNAAEMGKNYFSHRDFPGKYILKVYSEPVYPKAV